MTYAIGYIVYGIDLQAPSPYDKSVTDDWSDFRDIIDDLDEQELEVESRYNGNGDQPLFFGVELGQIDECKTIDGAELLAMLTVSDEAKAKFLEKVKAFYGEPTFFDFYNKLVASEPKVFITWGSS